MCNRYRDDAMPRSHRARRRARAQSGSAFILVLVALVVLSIVGVALISMTQTEMQIGTNERTSSRVFYAADAGVHFLAARKIVLNTPTGKTYVLPNTRVALGSGETRDQIYVDDLLAILSAPCNLCEVNYSTSSYTPTYVRADYGHATVGQRVGVKSDGKTTTIIGQHIITGELDIQPTQVPPAKAQVKPGAGACFGGGPCNTGG